MIEDIHIQPQPLSDVVNRGFRLGVSIFKKISVLFYIITFVYFVGAYYISSFLQMDPFGELFLTFANLTYVFFVMAYIARLFIEEVDKEGTLEKWSFIKQFPLLFIASVIFWILFFVGSLLFVVPGIILFLLFLFFPIVIAFEQKSLVASFKRSAMLVRGSFFRVAVIYALFLGLQACSIVFLSIFAVGDLLWLTAVIAGLIHIIILPFQAAVFNLLYFELRAEREAFDFEVFQYEARQQLTV